MNVWRWKVSIRNFTLVIRKYSSSCRLIQSFELWNFHFFIFLRVHFILSPYEMISGPSIELLVVSSGSGIVAVSVLDVVTKVGLLGSFIATYFVLITLLIGSEYVARSSDMLIATQRIPTSYRRGRIATCICLLKKSSAQIDGYQTETFLMRLYICGIKSLMRKGLVTTSSYLNISLPLL